MNARRCNSAVLVLQREGSLLGTDEVQRNMGNIMEGLKRSRDTMDVEDMMTTQVGREATSKGRRKGGGRLEGLLAAGPSLDA